MVFKSDRQIGFIGSFPLRRLRRIRQFNWSRDVVQENTLSVNDLIWPLFIADDKHAQLEIPSMPGVQRFAIDEAIHAIQDGVALGIKCIVLFPFTDPSYKNAMGDESINPDNVLCRAIRAIKQVVPDIGIMTDVALDPYTCHGHDGIMSGQHVLNDKTIEILCQQAINQAMAGADIIAPSDMMDGRIGAIRKELDNHDFQNTLIMSYAAKYASCFYGPFRDAIGSKGVLQGDKRTYQMNPANANEALHEVALDLEEGADLIMIKPGMPYLDICQRVKDTFGMPTFAYQTSGEYAMLQAAGRENWIDLDLAMMESLISFKRAGCDGILTYFAPLAARMLQNRNS